MLKCKYCGRKIQPYENGYICGACKGKTRLVRHLVKQFALVKLATGKR